MALSISDLIFLMINFIFSRKEDLQSRKKYLEESKEIKQSLTETEIMRDAFV